MRRFIILFILTIIISNPLSSQPGSGNGFTLTRNLEYYSNDSFTLKLDLYTPGGESLPSGIGVAGKDGESKTTENVRAIKIPVIIWVPGPQKSIFPTRAASLVGNGYAIASVQCNEHSKVPLNIYQALSFLNVNQQKYNIDTEKAGIIQHLENGYLAAVWSEGMEKMTTLSEAKVQTFISVPSEMDFSGLQPSVYRSLIYDFFDYHLRNGVHRESDPLSLKCPPDSWVDPVTYPIPFTSYNLFSTPSRGKGTEGSFLIYLPEDYNRSETRYPVIYWLHGGNGNSREGAWMCEQMHKAMQKGDMPQCIVVFVQGLPIGWYNNSVDGTMPVEDVVIKDLIPHIDATFKTIASRESRAIDGMSMGGYGSLHLGFKYPELFGVVSSIAPSITTYEMERQEVILPTFGNDTAYFNQNSPSRLIDMNRNRIKGKSIIRLLVGDKDFLYDLLVKFHFQLKDLGIDHHYSVAQGAGHDYKEVITNLEENSFLFWKEAFKDKR